MCTIESTKRPLSVQLLEPRLNLAQPCAQPAALRGGLHDGRLGVCQRPVELHGDDVPAFGRAAGGHAAAAAGLRAPAPVHAEQRERESQAREQEHLRKISMLQAMVQAVAGLPGQQAPTAKGHPTAAAGGLLELEDR